MIQSLGQKNPLEKEIAILSSFLAWEISVTVAWKATVHGVEKSWTQLAIKQQHHLKSHWKEQLRTFENNDFSNISFEKC